MKNTKDTKLNKFLYVILMVIIGFFALKIALWLVGVILGILAAAVGFGVMFIITAPVFILAILLFYFIGKKVYSLIMKKSA